MLKYIPGLNGLRAIAVIFVIISHGFPKEHIMRTFPLGNYGVDIFFVLSGFLISRSLFFQIINRDYLGISDSKIVKTFFIKRFLRIFPIYYLLLFFLYATSGIIGNNFKENFLWYFFYVANYLNYFQDKWFGALAHLWSLSVEEQFYILWPLLLLFVFKKRILILIFLLIGIGTIFPFFIAGNTKVLTLSCINAFGIGALLAYVEMLNPEYKYLFIKILKILFMPILLMLLYNNIFYSIPFFSERLAISIIAVSVIGFCLFNSENFIVNHILENKVLNFIGVISYGIYLYHLILPKYWVWGLKRIGWNTPAVSYNFSYLEFFIQCLVVILISYLSWIIVEKPILKFKKTWGNV